MGPKQSVPHPGPAEPVFPGPKEAVLDTQTDPAASTAAMPHILGLFKAISRLPDSQLDVMVLRHLCGFDDERASSLLGVPLATVRADERRAMRHLDSALTLPPDTEGPLT
ncbi:hypothetical protein GCM10023082_63960 [Streptomyces tremellae]|uniref:RNA polymerase sigma factor 70 region 4 type 2 domain-containing protein n=1 Tax=Streptomyces tremellae TaxID=1124239 RepID=A0ABP7GB47_9ACTN